MKRLMLVLAVGAAATLAGCEEPRREPAETAPAPVEAAPPAPPPPVEQPKPEPVTPTPPPSSVSALPPDERDSAETVKPESETLFY
jgi:hypothetical protein